MNEILWCPIDIPPIPNELNLKTIGENYTFSPNVDVEIQKKLAAERKHHLYIWDSFRLRVPIEEVLEPYQTQVKNTDWAWTEEAKNLCPGLIEYIEKNLPFEKIKYVTAISSKGSVPMHYDLKENISQDEKDFYKKNDPCFYRLILDGKISEDSFYIYTKTLGKVYCRMPEDSPGWVMGSYSCGHGNDENTPNQKLLLYIMGDLDLDRHQSLVQRSYSKYKDYAVIKDYGA